MEIVWIVVALFCDMGWYCFVAGMEACLDCVVAAE